MKVREMFLVSVLTVIVTVGTLTLEDLTDWRAWAGVASWPVWQEIAAHRNGP